MIGAFGSWIRGSFSFHIFFSNISPLFYSLLMSIFLKHTLSNNLNWRYIYTVNHILILNEFSPIHAHLLQKINWLCSLIVANPSFSMTRTIHFQKKQETTVKFIGVQYLKISKSSHMHLLSRNFGVLHYSYNLDNWNYSSNKHFFQTNKFIGYIISNGYKTFYFKNRLLPPPSEFTSPFSKKYTY